MDFITIKWNSGPVVKNAKFCKNYEIYENYNSDVSYKITNEVQNIHARTRYPDAILTKAISEKSIGKA